MSSAMRWIILLLAANGILAAALVGSVGHRQASVAADSAVIPANHILFPGGGEAVLRNGSWHFISPISWAADSIAIENAVDAMNSSGATAVTDGLRWKDFLHKRLLLQNVIPLKRLRLELGDRTILLKKKNCGWVLLPHGFVDGDGMDDFLNNLSLLTFSDVIDDELTQCSSKPQLVVVAAGAFKDQSEKLEFFLLPGEMAVARINAGVLFALPADAVKSLMSAAIGLRSRKIFYGLSGERILWRGEDGVTVLRRSESDGQIVAATSSPGGGEAFSTKFDGSTISNRILALCWSEIVVEEATETEIALYGLDRPRWELNVDGRTLLIGHGGGERVYCLDVSQSTIVSLSSDLLEDIAAVLSDQLGG